MSKRITLSEFELLVITIALQNSVQKTGTMLDKNTTVVVGNAVLENLYKKLTPNQKRSK